MTTYEAIEWAGSRRALSDRLGLRRQAIYKWGDSPPLVRQCEIELLSGGQLRADLPAGYRALVRGTDSGGPEAA